MSKRNKKAPRTAAFKAGQAVAFKAAPGGAPAGCTGTVLAAGQTWREYLTRAAAGKEPWGAPSADVSPGQVRADLEALLRDTPAAALDLPIVVVRLHPSARLPTLPLGAVLAVPPDQLEIIGGPDHPAAN